ncbi:MAG: DNA-directed RNA polymerase subunit P [Nitrososphaeria archaeon]|nr:DNA-directed RNA polymerase subunit P [Nitrososphaeria archaeon]NIN51757.1 DNA-directed RNA polymerase subunit P [Nitrososphaeria archaeon]NIQ32255.1 DNA-directed RNA polymerase subunit P [Nitrososphaeria archaeon]
MSFEKAKNITYICVRCGAKMKGEDLSYIGILECLECGYEVLEKSRPDTVKAVKAE